MSIAALEENQRRPLHISYESTFGKNVALTIFRGTWIHLIRGVTYASDCERLWLLPKREGQKRADDLPRALLNTLPEPFTPKPKPTRAKKK